MGCDPGASVVSLVDFLKQGKVSGQKARSLQGLSPVHRKAGGGGCLPPWRCLLPLEPAMHLSSELPSTDK